MKPLLSLLAATLLVCLTTLRAQTFADRNKKEVLNILPKDDKKFTYSIGGTAASIIWVPIKYNSKPYVLASDISSYRQSTTNLQRDNLTTTKDEI